MKAGVIIKAEHEQSYGSGPTALNDLQESRPATNMDLPAGLGNIRNTCYLNSILQYLFTVRQIREIVLDWDKYGLENIEENLMARRIDPGSTRVERGEAFAGQKCKSASHPHTYGVFSLISRSRQRTSHSLLRITDH